MDISVEPILYEQKSVFIQMLELYNYDFSEFSNDDINEYGYFGYAHIDDYWRWAISPSSSCLYLPRRQLRRQRCLYLFALSSPARPCAEHGASGRDHHMNPTKTAYMVYYRDTSGIGYQWS